MGTETFTAFKSDGTAYKLKGRILRHLDNDPVTETDKSNIRTTLGITSNGGLGDLLAANNLDDVASAATSRTNLDVNSIAQDAEATGTKLHGSSLRFDGSNDYIEFADNDAFTFSTGTDTPFSVSATVKMEDATSFPILAKYAASTSLREFRFQFAGDDRLAANLSDSSGNLSSIQSDEILTALEGQWVHVTMTYAGSSSLSTAANGLELYLNGKLLVTTKSNNASYTGISNTTQPLWVGQQAGVFADGEIRDVKLYNKELSAAEVKTLCLSGSLPESFAESTGAIAYAQDTTPSGEWSATNVTASDEAGPISGRSNILKLLVSAGSSTHYIQDAKLTSEKRFRISGSYYIPSSNSNADGFRVGTNTSTDLGASISAATLDAWTEFSCEFTSNAVNLRISLSDGGSQTFDDSGGNDVAYFDNIRVTQIGSVLDARAENYNQSAGKLLDVTSNNFVGTGSGVTIINPRTHISAETLDLTNLPTSVSGLSTGEVYNDSGTLKITL